MPVFGSDAYAPQEIAARVRDVGLAKVRLPWLTQGLLGVLAGAFIGLGTLDVHPRRQRCLAWLRSLAPARRPGLSMTLRPVYWATYLRGHART